MDNSQLLKKIDSLPKVLQQQVTDFVDFLLLRNSQTTKGNTKLKEDNDLTEDEKQELSRRLNDYLENPNDGVSIEKIKEKYRKKYGLQS